MVLENNCIRIKVKKATTCHPTFLLGTMETFCLNISRLFELGEIKETSNFSHRCGVNTFERSNFFKTK